MVAIYVKCVALFFIPLYFVNVLRNGIQGMGYDTAYPARQDLAAMPARFFTDARYAEILLIRGVTISANR